MSVDRLDWMCLEHLVVFLENKIIAWLLILDYFVQNWFFSRMLRYITVPLVGHSLLTLFFGPIFIFTCGETNRSWNCERCWFFLLLGLFWMDPTPKRVCCTMPTAHCEREVQFCLLLSSPILIFLRVWSIAPRGGISPYEGVWMEQPSFSDIVSMIHVMVLSLFLFLAKDCFASL